MVKYISIKHFLSTNGWWFWPIIAMMAITPWTPSLDLAIESYFYAGNGVFSQHPLFTFMYKYGPFPAEFVVFMSLICFILSYFIKTLKKWRPIAIILVLTLAIGSGLITHLILKDHWGRPRPKQIIEFGGLQEFRAYYKPNLMNQPEPSKSFPCGHCTMGFYFFSLVLIGKRLNRRWLFWAGILLTVALGGLLSFARMAQGGHFFSDVLISTLIMWLTAYLLVSKFLTKEVQWSYRL